jgi:hypothetical protein
MHQAYAAMVIGEYTDESLRSPHSIAAQPVFTGLQASSSSRSGLEVAGYIYSVIDWGRYLQNILPEGVNGVVVVLRNTCNQAFTYLLEGNRATLIGQGDTHDPEYDENVRIVDFSDFYFDPNLTSTQGGHCQIFLDLYPSHAFKTAYASSLSTVFSVTVAVLFVAMTLIFIFYDCVVSTRNHKVVGAAARTSSMVNSLFPDQIKNRLLDGFDDYSTHSKNMKAFTTNVHHSPSETGQYSKPLADLYPGKHNEDIYSDVCYGIFDVCCSPLSVLYFGMT